MKSIWQNFWSITGAVLSIFAAMFFIGFLLVELAAPIGNPYVGIWTLLILPALLVLGLILIPLGYLVERSRRRRLYPGADNSLRLPHFNPNNPRHVRALLIFAVGTIIAVPLIGIASYKGYHYTDSTQFCGQVCHAVMKPEYETYKNSPHARVACAACHIGPGAEWYVKAKISGVRQVLAVTFNTYSRPIPTPVRNLRPARETCEQCHWPAKFYAAQLRSRVHFASDEKNTRSEIQILVKTGGGDARAGTASGIHWHMMLSREIQYRASDEARQSIPWVQARDLAGTIRVYRAADAPKSEPPAEGRRTLDCMDCHNRPTHQISPPDRAVNVSLEAGRLDRTMPYIKKSAVEALTLPFGSEAEADRGIEAHLRAFYRNLQSGAAVSESSLAAAVQEIRAIYHRNFFPAMKVDWRVYIDNIGHMMFAGCFRCHDGKHMDRDGKVITRDCSACHQFLEPAAGQSQTYRQGVPEHPLKLEGEHARLQCNQCHTGGRAPERTCAGCHIAQNAFRQGRNPTLPGVPGTAPSFMAALECEQCHDVSKARTPDNIAARCSTCHDKTYGDIIKSWKDDADAGRTRAADAIAELEKNQATGKSDDAIQALIAQMKDTLAQINKAGPQHNLDFAEALRGQIIKLARENIPPAPGK
jgi:hypothetical protein